MESVDQWSLPIQLDKHFGMTKNAIMATKTRLRSLGLIIKSATLEAKTISLKVSQKKKKKKKQRRDYEVWK